MGRSVTTTWSRDGSRSRTTRSIAAACAYENPSLLSTTRGSARPADLAQDRLPVADRRRGPSSANERRPVTARTALDEWRELPGVANALPDGLGLGGPERRLERRRAGLRAARCGGGGCPRAGPPAGPRAGPARRRHVAGGARLAAGQPADARAERRRASDGRGRRPAARSRRGRPRSARSRPARRRGRPPARAAEAAREQDADRHLGGDPRRRRARARSRRRPASVSRPGRLSRSPITRDARGPDRGRDLARPRRAARSSAHWGVSIRASSAAGRLGLHVHRRPEAHRLGVDGLGRSRAWTASLNARTASTSGSVSDRFDRSRSGCERAVRAGRAGPRTRGAASRGPARRPRSR